MPKVVNTTAIGTLTLSAGKLNLALGNVGQAPMETPPFSADDAPFELIATLVMIYHSKTNKNAIKFSRSFFIN